MPLDLLIDSMSSQTLLDFGWVCHFDNGAEGLPTLESESSSVSLSTYWHEIAAESESEIYRRIRVLENTQYSNHRTMLVIMRG